MGGRGGGGEESVANGWDVAILYPSMYAENKSSVHGDLSC
jgi:hypothetical protein